MKYGISWIVVVQMLLELSKEFSYIRWYKNYLKNLFSLLLDVITIVSRLQFLVDCNCYWITVVSSIGHLA